MCSSVSRGKQIYANSQECSGIWVACFITCTNISIAREFLIIVVDCGKKIVLH